MKRIETGANATNTTHAIERREAELDRLKESAKALATNLIDVLKSGGEAANAGATASLLGRQREMPVADRDETKLALALLSDALKELGVKETIASRFAGALEALVEAQAVTEKRAENVARPLVFSFGGSEDGAGIEGDKRKLLGGKGAELLEMSRLGLPIPPGFTITTEACASYLETKQWPEGLNEQVERGLRDLEARTGKKFGDPENPLLVSVRSGAAVSMPGMMDTILNLGLNDEACAGLAKATGNERFAYDAYRRFISMFGNVAMGVAYEHFEEALATLKKEKGVKQDVELTAEDLKELVRRYRAIYREQTGTDFPSDAKAQLQLAIGAVFNSWNNDRAIKYREINKIEGLLGTAVNVQSMVFGNMGETSGTGVCFTRNPGTGARELFGEFLTNAQGEDVVAGIRTPMPITKMAELFPEAYEQLLSLASKLESHYRNMQDIEFTVENGKLFILQTRSGKRNGEAAVKIAVDLVREGLTDPKTAVMKMVDPEHVEQMLRPRFAETDGTPPVKLAKGIAASPGAAVGRAVFTVEDAIALAKQGTPVILIRNDTSPEDVGGMDAAQGVLTRTGGKTSHAAVVARGWGKPCVTGCGDLEIDEKAKRFTTPDGTTVSHGDWISLNGSTGEVVLGKRKLVQPEPSGDLATLLNWVDDLLHTEIRVSAESAAEAERALAFGADGIGWFRTDHLFFVGENLRHTQEMILAKSAEERREALAKEHEAQKGEIVRIYELMGDAPVTIRLLSATMDKFLPDNDKLLRKLADDLGIPYETVQAKRDELKHADPTLGLKGCRLAFEYPEITEAQTRAILEAALDMKEKGIAVTPEIVVPMANTAGEFLHQKEIIERTAASVFADRGAKVDFRVGATIETPRAAMVAGEIARVADFLTIDTDALTQLAFGVSKGAAGALIERYLEKDILKSDPFASFDRRGVGKLLETAVAQARSTKPEISIRIAGALARDADAVEFAVGTAKVDGVSTSWREVPVAKLIAAKVEGEGPKKKKKVKKPIEPPLPPPPSLHLLGKLPPLNDSLLGKPPPLTLSAEGKFKSAVEDFFWTMGKSPFKQP